MARRRRPPPEPSPSAFSVGVAAPARRPLVERWWGKILLLLLGTLLLTLAFAPFYQFWAAWIGLVPLLVVLSHVRTGLRAAFWTWVAGVLFFAPNLLWLVPVTGPGVAGLVPWLGVYWATAGVLIWPWLRRAAGEHRPAADAASGVPASGVAASRSIPDLRPPAPDPRFALAVLFLFPTVWVALEWVRGTQPWGGFGWFALAYSQTPALPMCQVADVTGELGVSWWVAMVNAAIALVVINGWRLRGVARPVLVTPAVVAGVFGYGSWRFAETDGTLTPGPTVLVVQPNYPQDNTGEKGASAEDIIAFHVSRTAAAQAARARRGEQPADLVVWSETVMPPMNPEGREGWRRVAEAYEVPDHGTAAARHIGELARRHRSAVVTGGRYARDVRVEGRALVESGRRNSAYHFARGTGELLGRFDKIHLVPFGEFVPFRDALPWLYSRLVAFGPPNMADYELERGEHVTAFSLPRPALASPSASPSPSPSTDPADGGRPWRFVTPICFEDTDADLNARMVRGGAPRGSLDGGRKADLIVNITNDGWFLRPQLSQHLQIATFRSIENRAPTARSVNTGISGFIDSLGRTRTNLLIPVHTEGTLAHQVMLDSRVTFFTLYGNLIGPACGAVASGLAIVGVVRGETQRRRRRRERANV